MHTCLRVALAIFLVIHCSSCSLLARWGIIAPRFKVLDRHHQMVGNREFITRRILVNPQTGESILEMIQVSRQGSPQSEAVPPSSFQMAEEEESPAPQALASTAELEECPTLGAQ